MDDKKLARQIGAAIRSRRKEKGWTQAQLAEAVGVEKESVSRFENGAISPSVGRLLQLADALSSPISAFLCPIPDEIDAQAAALATLIHKLPAARRDIVVRLVENAVAVLASEHDT